MFISLLNIYFNNWHLINYFIILSLFPQDLYPLTAPPPNQGHF